MSLIPYMQLALHYVPVSLGASPHAGVPYAAKTGTLVTDVIPVSNTGVFAWAFGRGPPLPNIRRGVYGSVKSLSSLSAVSRLRSSLPRVTPSVGTLHTRTCSVPIHFFVQSHTKKNSTFHSAPKSPCTTFCT